MKRLFFQRKRKTKGQSLVELAISLPLFLMLLAGIIEVGNLLVQRQRITTAVDAGARFGSRGGSDAGIYVSSYNVLTQTMPIEELELWDIFIVRGQVNKDGTGWADGFQVQHVYGGQQTEGYTQTVAISETLKTDLLLSLQTRASYDPLTGEITDILKGGVASGLDGQKLSANEEVIGIIMSHKAETILGIQNYFGQDVAITAQKYMTVHSVGEQTNGCDVYPLAISTNARSLPTQENPAGETYYEITSSGYDPSVNGGIGQLDDYAYPGQADRPTWDEFRITFGDRSLVRNDQQGGGAAEGEIFILNKGEHFEWIFYGDVQNPDLTVSYLSTTATDMVWPGKSRNYNAYYGEFPDLSPGEGLHVGDRIKHATGANGGRAGAAFASLNPHIDVGRSIRVPIVDAGPGGTINLTSDNFKIREFIVIKIRGYGTDSATGKQFIVAETVGLDNSCGQIANR